MVFCFCSSDLCPTPEHVPAFALWVEAAASCLVQAVFLDSHVVPEVRLIYHPCHELAGLPEEENLWKQAVMKPQKRVRNQGGSMEAGVSECQKDGLLSHVSGSDEKVSQ